MNNITQLISIIIPVFNEGESIAYLLDEVLNVMQNNKCGPLMRLRVKHAPSFRVPALHQGLDHCLHHASLSHYVMVYTVTM